MATRSVKVGNLSSGATEHDIKEFFSFSGEVETIDIQFNEHSAYVTFKDPQGAETAVLLSGASIADQSVIIEMAPNYTPPAAHHTETQSGGVGGAAESVVQKAEDVVSSMLAKGFILGKTPSAKAKAFDEKLGFTSNRNRRSRFHRPENRPKPKIHSRYEPGERQDQRGGPELPGHGEDQVCICLCGTDAFSRVAKAAGEVSQKTKEKVEAEHPPPSPQPSESSQQQPPERTFLCLRRLGPFGVGERKP
ncbi:Binding partner of ACD11 1 [Raphanus sativus]|nr:Binding partner of ACD11 1 [Raphanus sativus]